MSERGRVAPIGRKAEQTMDKLLESHPEFTALKYVGRTSEEVTAVMNALRDNSSVTALYELEGGDEGLTDEALRNLMKVLKLNNTMRKIHISSDAITAEGIKHLAEGISGSRSVYKLALWSRSVGDDAVTHLAKAVASDQCPLSELYLNLASVTDDGALKLQEAVHCNESLEKVQLEMDGKAWPDAWTKASKRSNRAPDNQSRGLSTRQSQASSSNPDPQTSSSEAQTSEAPCDQQQPQADAAEGCQGEAEDEEVAVEEESGVVLCKDEPKLANFFKMKRIRIPIQSIKEKMGFEGLDPNLLDTPDAPSPFQ